MTGIRVEHTTNILIAAIKQWMLRFFKILPISLASLLIACTSSPLIAVTPRLNRDNIIAIPIRSIGCGKPAPFSPGASTYQSLVSGGVTRFYLLHIPRGYAAIRHYPLVLNFHGHGSNSLQQEHNTGFSLLDDQHGVIVAYPQGFVGPDHQTGWDIGPPWDPRVNDVLFVSDLLNHLQATLCIDAGRIYATGFSNGGGMTNLLACDLSRRIAAFASVSGSYPPVPGGCHPARPIPILEIHGTADRIVPYIGSPSKHYPPIDQWLQQWAKLNGCRREPVVFFKTSNVIGEEWTGCRNDAVLVHYRIQGMGHIWPARLLIHSKGRSQIMTFDATTLIWTFFLAYPLPTTGV